MATDTPEETNRYVRINRKELITDTDVSQKSSIVDTITNPNDWKLLSRIGDAGANRTPLPGYCLHFDRTNPNVSIQTSIPSSERDTYNIVIKGEGLVDLLFVDTGSTNIAIRPKTYIPTSSSLYFDLSYIAFINKTTKELEHLFECEESSGTILYDAVTGDIANIENAVNLAALRTSKISKEHIKDSQDLLNTVKFDADNKGRIDTPITSLPSIFSIIFELRFEQSLDDFFNSSYNNRIIYKALDTADANEYLYFRRNSNTTFGLYYKTKNNTTIVNSSLQKTDPKLKTLFDGKFHKIAIVFGQTSTKWYIDSNLAVETDRAISEGFIDNTPVRIGTQSNQTTIEYSGFTIFNFDITSDSAKYTLEDFNSNKDIPASLLSEDYSNFKSISTSVSSGTPIGTVTQTSNSVLTFTDYASVQFTIQPALSSDITSAIIMPGAELTVKYKIDGYTKQTSDGTVVDLLGNIYNRLSMDSNYPNNYNRYWYAGADKITYTVSEENGTVISTYTNDLTSGTALSSLNADTITSLLRPVDAYETSRPRILTITYRLANNIMKTGTLMPAFANLVFRSGSDNNYSFTGTIELLDITMDRALISLGNFGHNGYIYCLDKVLNSAPTSHIVYQGILNSKNYGTFANAYGYTKSSNIIVPRKVN